MTYHPLTERILDRLPGSRLAWMVGWASLASVTYWLTHYLDPSVSYPGDAFVVAFAFANLIGLWAASEVDRRIRTLEPTLDEMLPPGQTTVTTFVLVGSTIGPWVFSLLASMVFELADLFAHPSLAQAARVLPVLVGQLSGWAFMWVYAAVLISLVRIGGQTLQLPSFVTDPGLGLRPFGRIAFIGFSAVAVPMGAVLLTASEDPRTASVGLGVILSMGGLFFASLYRLHLQLIAAKSRYMAWARGLYAQALAPVQAEPNPAVLDHQSASLASAAEIERRVHQIAEWPFDDWVLRGVVAILLGGTAGLAARAVATGIGI